MTRTEFIKTVIIAPILALFGIKKHKQEKTATEISNKFFEEYWKAVLDKQSINQYAFDVKRKAITTGGTISINTNGHISDDITRAVRYYHGDQWKGLI